MRILTSNKMDRENKMVNNNNMNNMEVISHKLLKTLYPT